MSSTIISPKAEVSPKARIGEGCKIFPFVYIEDDVVIGDNCIIFPFVSILNGTRMGNGNKIHQGSVIAALPQDFNFKGANSQVVMGDMNIIRENVVINRGTHEGGKTVLGSNNVLMEGVHISHDTRVSDACVIGYGTKIAKRLRDRGRSDLLLIGHRECQDARGSWRDDPGWNNLLKGRPALYRSWWNAGRLWWCQHHDGTGCRNR